MKNKPTRDQVLRICDFFANLYNRFFPGSPITIELGESVDKDYSNPTFSVKFGQDQENQDMFFALTEMYLIKLSALKGEYVDVSISYRENSVIEEDNPTNDRVYQFNFGKNNVEEIEASLHTALEVDSLNTDNMKAMTYYKEGEDIIKNPLPVLDMQGMALINYNKNQQPSKGKRANENIFICGSDEIFLQTMELLNRKDVPDNLDLVLVKRCGAGHAQSIKLERRNGQNNFIIVDSTPQENDFSAPYPMMTALMLRKYFPDSKIYSLKEQRQYNRVGCHTYAIKDSQILLMSKDMHKELEGNILEEVGKNIFVCKSPGKFVVFSQSRQEIVKYVAGDPNYSFLDKDGKTIHRLLGDGSGEICKKRPEIKGVKHPFIDRKGIVPSVIDYFARKYSEIIDTMRSKSEGELKDIIDSQNAKFLTIDKLKEMASIQYPGLTNAVSGTSSSKLKLNSREQNTKE